MTHKIGVDGGGTKTERFLQNSAGFVPAGLVGVAAGREVPRYDGARGVHQDELRLGATTVDADLMSHDFAGGTSRICSAGEGKPDRFSAYTYASGEVRAVARDIFLDGNTWRHSHSVDKRPVVADLSLGFVLHWPRFQVAYTQDYRTKEFYGQLRRDVFGSVGFSFSR